MSILSTGTTTGTACSLTADTSGDCVIKTGSSATTAMTISGSTQAVTLAGSLVLGSSTLAAPSGSAPSYTCRAWVNFNGTGTPAIRASGNVSSITDILTGEWQINFTTPLPDADYTAVGAAGNHSSVNGIFLEIPALTTPTTSAVRCAVITHGGSIVDAEVINVAIFR